MNTIEWLNALTDMLSNINFIYQYYKIDPPIKAKPLPFIFRDIKSIHIGKPGEEPDERIL